MPAAVESDLVSPIRDASRKLVRELGFMRRTLAGTNLSSPAVHMLLEIGDHGVHDATELHSRLRFEGGTGNEFEAAVKELKFNGEITAESSAPGVTTYHVTTKGAETLLAINALAVQRVQQALDSASPGDGDTIVQGMRLYANALAASSPIATQVQTLAARPAVRIEPGYRPGFLARNIEMHIEMYHEMIGWGRVFEAALAKDFGGLIERLDDRPDNQIWSAVQDPATPGGKERIVGTILLDAELPGEPGTARIRGFIVDPDARGLGVGKKLMKAVMDFVAERGFAKVVLSTIDGLSAALHLYRSFGFELVGDKEEIVYERTIRAMQFVWHRPAAEVEGRP